MYGFYVTNKGEELISHTLQGEKIRINKACFGSGADHNKPFNFDITDLVSQFYEKELNPDTDMIGIDPSKPNQIRIVTELPASVSGTINEIGYKDENDNLILYGIVEEEVKDGSKNQIFRYENYVFFENSELESIQFSVMSPEYGEVIQNMVEVTSKANSAYETANSCSESIKTFSEKINNLDEIEQKVTALEGLEDRVASLETLPDKVTKLEGLDDRVTELETLPDRITALEKLPDKVTALEKLPDRITELEKLPSRITELEKLPSRVTELEKLPSKVTALEGLVDRVSALETTLSGVEEMVSSINTRLEAIV